MQFIIIESKKRKKSEKKLNCELRIYLESRRVSKCGFEIFQTFMKRTYDLDFFLQFNWDIVSWGTDYVK